MQKRILITVILISSCVSVDRGFPEDTSETSLERASRCANEYINDYWGDCWIQESLMETNFLSWVSYLNMSDSWYMLRELNEKLLIGLKNNKYQIKEANDIFGQAVNDIDIIVNAKIQTNIALAEQKKQQIGMVLMALSASINQTNQTISQRQTYQTSIPVVKYLTSRRALDNGRTECTYGAGITATVIVNYGSFCAPSI